ncbi:MAG: hypothetical protein CMI05_06945 [Oceanospirillaceae bacterium]|nr:hypothetical protein [Oceanospirillaceae bacterium]
MEAFETPLLKPFFSEISSFVTCRLKLKERSRNDQFYFSSWRVFLIESCIESYLYDVVYLELFISLDV